MMRIIRSLIANLASFVLALILAVLIWGFAVRANDPLERLQVEGIPVQVIGRPAESMISGVPPDVDIAVEGPASTLAALTPNTFTAEVDLTDLPPGQYQVPVDVHANEEGISLVWQSAEEVPVAIERIVTQDLPVRLEIRNTVARGYEMETPFVDPETIQVTGPASRVEALAEARITVFLDNPQEDITVTRRPIFYDRQGNIASVNGLTLSPEEVVVTIPVDQLAGYAAKPIIVNWEGEPAPGYRILNVNVEPDSVLVTGRPNQLDNLSRVQTEPIDITGLRDTETFEVALDLPAGIEMDEVQPILVEIEIEPILTSSVVRKTPEIRALGQGLTVTMDVEEVRVFLFGPLEKLDSLMDSDLRVTVDLFGLDAGTYRLEPDADVFVSDVEVRSIQPSQLTVVLTDVVTTTVPTNTLSLRNTVPLPSSAPRMPQALFALFLAGSPAALLPGALLLFRRERFL